MSKIREAVVGATLTAISLTAVAAMDSPIAEAAPAIDQGFYPIPSDCKVYRVGDRVSLDAEKALRAVGFTGIKVDGEISNDKEQEAVRGAQIFMQDRGALDSDVKACGYAGSITKKSAENMLNPGGVNESQITKSQTTSRNNISNSSPKSREKTYSIDDCKNYNDLSIDTVKAIQRALGVKDDGVFGNQTCNAMINFQESNGIAEYGKGSVGPRTAGALGVTLNMKTQANNADFSPVEDCPRPTSCDIKVNLTSQRMKIINAMGVIVWDIPVQSGKKGMETRTGTDKLGPVEYGPGKNPERKSRDYPEATLVNARGFGNGGQKFHGSYSFNQYAIEFPEKGSAGCIRVYNTNSFVLAQMPSGTDVTVFGAKPGTQQRYFR